MERWYSCKFVVLTDIKIVNPLHALSVESNEQIKNIDESTSIIAVRTPRVGSSDALITVYWSEDEEFDHLKIDRNKARNAEEVTLHISGVLIERYSLVVGVRYTIRKVNPFPLERVSLGTTSEELYAACSEQKWVTNMLVRACREKVLCRQGFFLFSNEGCSETWDELQILECKPVMQGVMTMKTTVVVVLLDDVEKMEATSGDEVDENNVEFSFEQYKTLLKYMGTLLLCKKPEAMNPLLLMASVFHMSSARLSKPRLNVVVLPTSPFAQPIEGFDPTNSVTISKDFSDRRQLRSKEWVKIALENNDGELKDVETVKFRCAQVHVDEGNDFQLHDSSCCVSPQLWFNINEHPSSLIQPGAKMTLTKLGRESNIESTTEIQPLYANEASIALVQAPCYHAEEHFDSLCSKYFSTTRYVQVGDIICIGSTGDIEFLPTSNDPLKLCQASIYFKITQLSGNTENEYPGYVMDNQHTNLYQAGTVFSFIPVTMDVHNGSSCLHPIWNNPVPCGLDKYVSSLERLLIPFMKSVYVWSNSEHVREHIVPTFLLTGSSGIGKQTILKAVCCRLNMHYQQVDCNTIVGETSGVTETKLKQILNEASTLAPCVFVLRNVHVLGSVKDGSAEDLRVLNVLSEAIVTTVQSSETYPLIIAGTSPKQSLVASDLLSIFVHQLHVEQPTKDERIDILNGLLSKFRLSADFSIHSLADKTASFLLGDLCTLVASAVRITYKRVTNELNCAEASFYDEDDINLAGVCLETESFNRALDEMRSAHSDAIGAPKIPTVKWEDIGGLQNVKDAILDTVQLPLQHPELVASGLKRSGILLFGPPGTGKTMLAKAVATECSLHFLSVKGPELLNMYVGQSEENVREVFQRARSVAPCIIFFDELDSLAPNRGRSGDSGGVMDRVVSQLLAELDGLDKTSDIFVIGATNRPDLIDPALLRPGRFDKTVYVGISEDSSSQLSILKALTRKFNLAPDVCLEKLVERCPPNLTGADFYALCSDALVQSMNRCIEEMKMGVEGNVGTLIVNAEDFERAIDRIIPSVSMEELKRYQDLKTSLSN